MQKRHLCEEFVIALKEAAAAPFMKGAERPTEYVSKKNGAEITLVDLSQGQLGYYQHMMVSWLLLFRAYRYVSAEKRMGSVVFGNRKSFLSAVIRTEFEPFGTLFSDADIQEFEDLLDMGNKSSSDVPSETFDPLELLLFGTTALGNNIVKAERILLDGLATLECILDPYVKKNVLVDDIYFEDSHSTLERAALSLLDSVLIPSLKETEIMSSEETTTTVNQPQTKATMEQNQNPSQVAISPIVTLKGTTSIPGTSEISIPTQSNMPKHSLRMKHITDRLNKYFRVISLCDKPTNDRNIPDCVVTFSVTDSICRKNAIDMGIEIRGRDKRLYQKTINSEEYVSHSSSKSNTSVEQGIVTDGLWSIHEGLLHLSHHEELREVTSGLIRNTYSEIRKQEIAYNNLVSLERESWI
jgi:hypothetical protein